MHLGAVQVLAREMPNPSLTQASASRTPPLGQGYFYLIQEVTAQGRSGYGTESVPWPRVPDSCDGGCPGSPEATSGEQSSGDRPVKR